MYNKLKGFIPGENTAVIMTAAVIGLLAGGVIIVFRESVELVHELIFTHGHELLGIKEVDGWSELLQEGGWRRLFLPLIPMFGMVLLIPLSLLFPGDVNGYGFTKFLRRVNLENGVINARNIFIKIAATAITIGSGNSAGVEGPTAQIGGALGSQFGQKLRVSGARMKVYIAAGSAGAAEIILLGTYKISSFSALVVASAMATVVSRAYYGKVAAFPIPDYRMVNPLVEIPLYAVMAVLIGLLAVAHIRFFLLCSGQV